MGAGYVPIVHKPQFRIEGNLVAAIASGKGKILVEDLVDLWLQHANRFRTSILSC